MDGCIGVFEVVKFHTKRHRAGVKGFAHFKAISAYAWREHRSFFWEVIVVAAIVQAGVVVPLFFAIGNSAALLRAFHA